MAEVKQQRSKDGRNSTFTLTTTEERLKRDPIGETKALMRILTKVGNKGRLCMYSSETTSQLLDLAVEIEQVERNIKKIRDPRMQREFMEAKMKMMDGMVQITEGINDIRSKAGLTKRKKKTKGPKKFEPTQVGEGFENEKLKEKEGAEVKSEAASPKQSVEGFDLES